ncbi:MAG: radical SAM protein [Desulfomonilaceae bacterium]|nr:radical SAM protein [Desulfomonilaceae bacterium]
MTRPGETGAYVRNEGSAIAVALVYPNAYRVGMGNLGFQYVYHYLNNHPQFSAERFFRPDPAVQPSRRGHVPLSEESSRPLNSFSVIAFSIPFENDYPAVPGLLNASGIPPLQRDRGAADPLVMAGGVSVSLNPEPLAPFLDLAFIGELDQHREVTGLFAVLADALARSRYALTDRRGFLSAFRDTTGVYVPSSYDFTYGSDGLIREIKHLPGFPGRVRAVKRVSTDLPVPVSVLFSKEAEFGESLLVESNRGCGRGCRFCAAGWIHRPVRYREFSAFKQQADRAIETGRTIGLIGSDLAGHPELEDILEYIVDRGGRFSLSSIRPEGLSDKVIRLLARTGQKTATLAPEAASQRLRKVIGKDLPSDAFHDLVGKLVSQGIPNIRFYFMVGLPTETDEDVEAIVEFVSTARDIFVKASRPLGRIGRIGVQLNPFIPKPWTPFQWAGMAEAQTLRRRIRLVQNGLKRRPNLVIRSESVPQALLQGLISRGDRRISAALTAAGARAKSRPRLVGTESLDPVFYLHRERAGDEVFPWDVVDHGIAKQTLRRIYVASISVPPDSSQR